MKLQVIDGAIVLADVFNGIGIQTDMGIFAIAQRDSGVEVMLNGRSVWSSHELPPAPDFQYLPAASLRQTRLLVVQRVEALEKLGGRGKERVRKLQRTLQALDTARTLLNEVFCVENRPGTKSPYDPA